jgi:2',3'-cyclic-nucleotide 2'-phosphodiesterase (5'-nucleotidase family)
MVEETGAWMVQSGYYAKSVGYLELTVDLKEDSVAGIKGHLVPMSHETISPDLDMLEWVNKVEAENCPEASNYLFYNPTVLGREELAWLAAEAMRRSSGAEIAFCHGGQVIRSTLPTGPIDVNAVFLTGGFRAHLNYNMEMTGSEIEAYLKALADDGRSPTSWTGFRAEIERNAAGGYDVSSDLNPLRQYKVLMPEVEYRTRLMRVARKQRERSIDSPLVHMQLDPVETDVTFIDSMASYLKKLADKGSSLPATAASIQSVARSLQ